MLEIVPEVGSVDLHIALTRHRRWEQLLGHLLAIVLDNSRLVFCQGSVAGCRRRQKLLAST